MGKIIVKAAIVRQPGMLYYIDATGSICEAKMVRKSKKVVDKKKAVTNKTVDKKDTTKKATVKKKAK